MKEYLQILGVPENATFTQAKEAYRDLIRIWHPDRYQHDPRLKSRAEAETKKLNATWEKLSKINPNRFNQKPEATKNSNSSHNNLEWIPGFCQKILRDPSIVLLPLFLLGALTVMVSLGIYNHLATMRITSPTHHELVNAKGVVGRPSDIFSDTPQKIVPSPGISIVANTDSTFIERPLDVPGKTIQRKEVSPGQYIYRYKDNLNTISPSH
jgi:hypothetical protein